MKRLISLALVLLMAAVAVDASAQASKLVGKWSIDPTTMIVDIGKFPNMSLILEVDADGEAEIQSMCQGEASIDDTVSIHFILKIDFNFNWTLTGNTLSLQDTGEVVADVDNVFAGGDAVSGPSTVIRAVAAGKVAAANIDAYLGFDHKISTDVEIPASHLTNTPPCGRVNLKSHCTPDCQGNFDLVVEGMSKKEKKQKKAIK